MRTFFLFSVVYFLCAVGVVAVFREDGVYVLAYMVNSSMIIVGAFQEFLLPLIALITIITFSFGPKAVLRRISTVLPVFAACVLFQAAFTLIKTTLPAIVPFYADPYFAQIDQALHFGQDPWVWTHALTQSAGVSELVWLYVSVWTLPAMTLPVIIAAIDNDTERTNRFLALYVIAWVILGNIVALVGMSAGPVFYDRLMDVDRFALLAPALIDSGVQSTWIGVIQENLWNVHVSDGQAIGSGISAFPSVHVAMAAVTALYLGERSKYLRPTGLGFVVAILFMSVYSGYHYAIDGYASLIVIGASYAALRKANRRPQWQLATNNAMS